MKRNFKCEEAREARDKESHFIKEPGSWIPILWRNPVHLTKKPVWGSFTKKPVWGSFYEETYLWFIWRRNLLEVHLDEETYSEVHLDEETYLEVHLDEETY